MTQNALTTELALAQLPLHPLLLASAAAAGFSHCTPIQAATLPLLLQDRDVAGEAQTGTGKTAAFLFGTLQRLLQRPAPPERRANQPRALILAPTRELAAQIHKDAEALAAGTGLVPVVAYGGTGYQQQREQIASGVDLLIGTPGRIIDYFKQRVFDFRHTEVVVLDEADRMFDLGFIRDIRYLLRRLPPTDTRLNLLFSATLSYRVTELAYEHMNAPQLVRIDPARRTAAGARQRLYHVADEDKIPALLTLLGEIDQGRVMIFCNTKRDCDRVHRYLRGNDYRAGLLSGDVPQQKRERLLQRFDAGELDVLVATDVAARGLHIPDVSHVINYDLPQDAQDYVHRIGRTARAGSTGEAIALCCERYCYSLPEIEDYIGEKIEVTPLPATLVTPAPATRSASAATPRRGRRRPPATAQGSD
ncbi:MAG: DEAD/DEAH box helicase [Pseudomonadota bacterium]|nr:DEAD/DEAH box helicase [Pseudomonadota bacterium]HJO34593.1 DEAD/DEAH box helicase [Gammaproteobacteria bacterium]